MISFVFPTLLSGDFVLVVCTLPPCDDYEGARVQPCEAGFQHGLEENWKLLKFRNITTMKFHKCPDLPNDLFENGEYLWKNSVGEEQPYTNI